MASNKPSCKVHDHKCFRVFDVPRYYVSRQQDVDSVLRMFATNRDNSGESATSDEDKGGPTMGGILGWGGTGKTTLAKKVCELLKPNWSVIWLPVGEKPDIAKLFNQIHEDLTGVRGSFLEDDISNASYWLKEISKKHQFFLVLDDVWKLNHVAPFTCISTQCSILITTRIESILLDADASIHKLECLDARMSRELLLKCSGVELVDDSFGEIIQTILDFLDGLPLAIVLIGSSLKGKKSYKDWRFISERMIVRKESFWRGMKRGLPDNLYNHQNMYEAFEVSFQALNPNDKGTGDPASWNLIQKRLLDFAIFSSGANIPSKVLFRLWKYQLGNDISKSQSYEFGEHIWELADKSFITLTEESDGCYSIHDLLLEYAKYKLDSANPQGLKRLHNTFLDSYSHGLVDNLGVCKWWEIEKDDFFYHHLFHHLFESGRHIELRNLLWNIAWLDKKLCQTDLSAILNDFTYLARIADNTGDKAFFNKDDVRLRKAIVLSCHVLFSQKDQLCPQLAGRLLGRQSEHIQAFVKSLSKYVDTKSDTKLLMPDTVCLSSSDGYRIQSLPNNLPVIHVALSNDNKFLYTCDDVVQRTDLLTGEETLVWQYKGDAEVVLLLEVDKESNCLITTSPRNHINVYDWSAADQYFSNCKIFKGHTDPVTSVTRVPEKNMIVSGCQGGTIRTWNTVTKSCMVVINNGCPVRCVAAVRNDSSIVLSISDIDGIVKLWDVQKNRLIHSFKSHSLGTIKVCVSPYGKKVVTAGLHDCLIKIWDRSGKFLTECRGHKHCITNCLVTSDNQHIVSGSYDSTACLWNIESGQLERTFSGHSQAVVALYASDDSKLIATGSHDGSAILWNSDLAGEVGTDHSIDKHASQVKSLASSADGKFVVSASQDRSLVVWQCAEMSKVKTLRGHANVINCVITSYNPRDSSELWAISADNDKTICIWNLSSGEETPLKILETSHNAGIKSLITCENGEFLVSMSHDKIGSGYTVLVHDLENYSLLMKLNSPKHSDECFVQSKDSKLFAEFSGSVKLWNVRYLFRYLLKHISTIEQGVDVHSQRMINFVSSLIPGEVAFFLDGFQSFNDLTVRDSNVLKDAFLKTGGKFENVGFINNALNPGKLFILPCPNDIPSKITSFARTPCNKACIAGYANGEIWAWCGYDDIFSCPPKPTLLSTLSGSYVTCADVYSEGFLCLAITTSANENGRIQVWDLLHCEANREWSLDICDELLWGNCEITNVVFVDSQHFLASARGGLVSLWNISKSAIGGPNSVPLKTGMSEVVCLVADPGQNLYACGGYGKQIEVRKISTGSLMNVITIEEADTVIKLDLDSTPGSVVCTYIREPVTYNIDILSIFSSKCVSPYGFLLDRSTGQRISFSNLDLKCACVMKNGYVATCNRNKRLLLCDITEKYIPEVVTSFTFEHDVTAVHEFSLNKLVVGLSNGQVCFLHVTGQ